MMSSIFMETKMAKRLSAVVLALLLAAFALVGCNATEGGQAEDMQASAEQAESRTIVDAVGREVEIPGTVEKIVPLGNTPRMVVYMGLKDKVVGVGGMKKEDIAPLAAYAYSAKDAWDELPIVGTDAAGATDYYPEQIISVAPDVILCTYTAEVADDIQAKTGIPVVAVPQGSLYQEDYEQALRLIGEVCGAEERAEEVIAFINDSLADLNKRTEGLADDQKPTVLGAGATFKGGHGIEGVYVKYPVFTSIGVNNLADEAAAEDGPMALTLDKEQILAWNPEVIFLDAGNIGLVKEDMAANPDFYEKLDAFKSGKVYQYPNSTYYYSNVEIPILNSYYVGKLLYPEQFADVEMDAKAAEIFGFFLGDADYLATLEAAGYGYGEAEL